MLIRGFTAYVRNFGINVGRLALEIFVLTLGGLHRAKFWWWFGGGGASEAWSATCYFRFKPESEILYYWRFAANQFVLMPSRFRSRPYVTSLWREDGLVSYEHAHVAWWRFFFVHYIQTLWVWNLSSYLTENTFRVRCPLSLKLKFVPHRKHIPCPLPSEFET
jgi:hypothetical protein